MHTLAITWDPSLGIDLGFFYHSLLQFDVCSRLWFGTHLNEKDLY